MPKTLGRRPAARHNRRGTDASPGACHDAIATPRARSTAQACRIPFAAGRAAGRPPAGGPDLLPDRPRYGFAYVIAFCDGHVEAVRPEDIGDLVWDGGLY